MPKNTKTYFKQKTKNRSE